MTGPITHTSWWSTAQGGTLMEVQVYRDGKWEDAVELEPGRQYTIRVRSQVRLIPDDDVKVALE